MEAQRREALLHLACASTTWTGEQVGKKTKRIMKITQEKMQKGLTIDPKNQPLLATTRNKDDLLTCFAVASGLNLFWQQPATHQRLNLDKYTGAPAIEATGQAVKRLFGLLDHHSSVIALLTPTSAARITLLIENLASGKREIATLLDGVMRPLKLGDLVSMKLTCPANVALHVNTLQLESVQAW